MNALSKSVVLLFGLSCVGVCADTLLKLASEQVRPFWNRWFLLGMGCSAVFAILWMLLVQVMKLATAGATSAVLSALMLVAIGIVVFGEKLSGCESAGVLMALVSVALLARITT